MLLSTDFVFYIYVMADFTIGKRKTLVIITWLADSCRNRMLRHCPTDDRIIEGETKGEWPLFLCNFLYSVWIRSLKQWGRFEFLLWKRFTKKLIGEYWADASQDPKTFMVITKKQTKYSRFTAVRLLFIWGVMCYLKIFSYMHAQNAMFLLINITVLSVSPKNDVFW